MLSSAPTVGTYNVQVTEEPTRPGTSLGCLYVVCSGTQKPKASCLLPGVKETVLWIRGPYSVQFSRSVVSDSLWPHGLQHARLPCPLPTPGACSNSCPLSQGCHPTISSSVVTFSSHLQSFLGSVFSNESVLHIRWPKYWSFSFSISPSNEYSGLISFRMDWLDLLAVQGTLKSGPYYEKRFKWTMLGTQQ